MTNAKLKGSRPTLAAHVAFCVVPADRVLKQAKDVERGAPLGGVAGARPGGHRPCRPSDPSRRVELELHERGARVVGRDGRVDDVAVTVRRAPRDLLRVGLRVAQRHAEPDRAVQLEVVGLGHRVARRRIVRHDHLVLVAVSRARLVRVDTADGSVVTHVLVAEHLLRVRDLRTQAAVFAVDRGVAGRPRRAGAAVAADLADAAGPAAIDAAATSSAPAPMNSRAGFISCSLRRASLSGWARPAPAPGSASRTLAPPRWLVNATTHISKLFRPDLADDHT